MATEPAPMPPTKDDPDRLAALAAKEQYTEAIRAIRFRSDIGDIDKARHITRLWNQLARDLYALQTSYRGRLTDRIDWLAAGLPVGPGVPPDASPADATVLHAAFRTALAAAREATVADLGRPEQIGNKVIIGKSRADMLADATRFGDEATIRAVLTSYADESRWDLIENWAEAQAPESVRELKEWLNLSKLLSGSHFDMQWIRQGFGRPDAPAEARRLPDLVAAHNATVDVYNRDWSTRQGQRARREPIVLTTDEMV